MRHLITTALIACCLLPGLVRAGFTTPAQTFVLADREVRYHVLGAEEDSVAIVLGGFLVGFGARYAGGCTSGHAITGMATMQLPSLIAVVGFFIGGLFTTYVLLPLLLG